MIKNTNWPFQSYGEQKQPPVIFLHGFLGDKEDWTPIQQVLAIGFWCIAPDLPGHGQNKQPLPDHPLTFDWLSQGLSQLMDELNISQAHLVGYSMGGRLGLYFSTLCPSRLLSLTLESASPGILDADERQVRCQEDARRTAQVIDAGLAPFIETWYQMPLFASLQHNPELLEHVINRRKQNDPRSIARIIAELSPGVQPALWDQLSNITIPVLLMAGEDDLKYRQMVAQMAEKIPNARIARSPGSGHNIHLESPGWFIRTLKKFLDET